VLRDVTHNFALIVTRTGDYTLHSPTTELFYRLSPILLVSDEACRYLSGRVVSLVRTPIKIADGGTRAVLNATLRVTTLRRPVVIAYSVTYSSFGGDIGSVERGGTPVTCIGRRNNSEVEKDLRASQ
jgi:hypothetical protein